MRQSKQIILWIAAVGSLAWSLYEWGFVEDGPAYFAADWRRALSVAALSVTGGLLVAFLMDLPSPVRRRICARFFGIIELLASAGGVWSSWQVLRFWTLFRQHPFLWSVTTAELGMCILVGCIAWSLRRHFLTGSTDEKGGLG